MEMVTTSFIDSPISACRRSPERWPDSRFLLTSAALEQPPLQPSIILDQHCKRSEQNEADNERLRLGIENIEHRIPALPAYGRKHQQAEMRRFAARAGHMSGSLAQSRLKPMLCQEHMRLCDIGVALSGLSFLDECGNEL